MSSRDTDRSDGAWRRRIGPAIAWALGLMPILLWFLAAPVAAPSGRRSPSLPIADSIGQLAGLTGMVMLSIAFILSSRARFLEPSFGGIDKMYREHHRLGMVAFSLLLIHPLALALRFVPDDWARFLQFQLPDHDQLAVDLGVYALWVLILLIGLTLYRRVPYDKWKLTHKGLGIVLVVAAIHMLAVEPTRGRSVAIAQSPLLRIYVVGVAAVGLLSYLYKLIAVPLLAARHKYVVQHARRLNRNVLEVVLSPVRNPISFEPGQFVFVTFFASGLQREAHPFTICSVPQEPDLALTIKALGDFTETVYRKLEPGASATVEGPYGRFDYREGGRRQIWLAGGVGVVPFLNWARNMAVQNPDGSSRDARDVDFYYCVHSRNDAVYHMEFVKLAGQIDGLRIVLVCSEESGRLRAADVENIQDATIFMCGPKRFTTDLQRQFVGMGVPRGRIHYEDFEFR